MYLMEKPSPSLVNILHELVEKFNAKYKGAGREFECPYHFRCSREVYDAQRDEYVKEVCKHYVNGKCAIDPINELEEVVDSFLDEAQRVLDGAGVSYDDASEGWDAGSGMGFSNTNNDRALRFNYEGATYYIGVRFREGYTKPPASTKSTGYLIIDEFYLAKPQRSTSETQRVQQGVSLTSRRVASKKPDFRGSVLRLATEIDVGKHMNFYDKVIEPLLLELGEALAKTQDVKEIKEMYSDLLHALSCSMWGCTGNCEDCKVNKVLARLEEEGHG